MNASQKTKKTQIEWQKVKATALIEADWTCKWCGEKENGYLDLYFIGGKNDDSEMVENHLCLCSKCSEANYALQDTSFPSRNVTSVERYKTHHRDVSIIFFNSGALSFVEHGGMQDTKLLIGLNGPHAMNILFSYKKKNAELLSKRKQIL